MLILKLNTEFIAVWKWIMVKWWLKIFVTVSKETKQCCSFVRGEKTQRRFVRQNIDCGRAAC